MKRYHYKQTGIGMLEVLIALLIMSIGILGVARMQGLSVVQNHEAQQRSQAVFIANDLLSKIRINPTAVVSYVGMYGSGQSASSVITCDSTQLCSPAQIAQYDLYYWEQLLMGQTEKQGSKETGGLLNANGCVRVNNNELTITVAWDSFSKREDNTLTPTCPGTADKFYRHELVINAIIPSI